MAARDAYIAALNAARAVVFEKTEIAVKTHAGARAKLFKLIHSGMEFDEALAKFLSEGFDTKQGLDYGPEIVLVDRSKAESYIARAAAFIAAARKVCT